MIASWDPPETGAEFVTGYEYTVYRDWMLAIDIVETGFSEVELAHLNNVDTDPGDYTIEVRAVTNSMVGNHSTSPALTMALPQPPLTVQIEPTDLTASIIPELLPLIEDPLYIKYEFWIADGQTPDINDYVLLGRGTNLSFSGLNPNSYYTVIVYSLSSVGKSETYSTPVTFKTLPLDSYSRSVPTPVFYITTVGGGETIFNEDVTNDFYVNAAVHISEFQFAAETVLGTNEEMDHTYTIIRTNVTNPLDTPKVIVFNNCCEELVPNYPVAKVEPDAVDVIPPGVTYNYTATLVNNASRIAIMDTAAAFAADFPTYTVEPCLMLITITRDET